MTLKKFEKLAKNARHFLTFMIYYYIINGVLPMEVYKFCPKTYVGSNSYVLLDGDEAAIVDPSITCADASSLIGQRRVRYILLTHCHYDHIRRIDEWVEKTGAEVIIGESDRGGLSSSIVNCYRSFLGVEAGYFGPATGVIHDRWLPLGNSAIRVISTPGHTAGGVSYYDGRSLFVGDTVFAAGGFGRCDLPGGDELTLFASIRRLCELPDGITVYCGHGEDTSTDELKMNFK